MPRLVTRAVALAVAFVLAAPPTSLVHAQSTELPALGDAGGDDLSAANERKLGEQVMREVRRDPSYLTDPDTTEYLNNLGYQLVAASPARHTDFQFFAVRDPTLNAFALPGGFIGVHTGLVLTAQSESELASVLAHEIGHISQRHVARMLTKQRESTAIALGALLLALLAARSNSSSSADLTQAAILGGQAAAIQQQLNFSRENEREADRVGFQTMTEAGFDPRAMASFFGRMQQGSRIYESAAPAYLRTHPLTVERISDIQNRVRETRTKQRADSLDFLLTRARLKVLQEDSLQGVRDARETFASQLKDRTAPSEVAARYGLAVALLRLNQPQAALDAANTARRLSKQPSAMLDKLVAEARFAAARTPQEKDEALALAREATARYPISRLTAANYVNLLQQTGRHEDAVAYLRDQLALPRTEPQYFSMLAKSYAALDRKTQQHQATAEMYVLLGAVPPAIEQLQLARKANDADFYTLSEVDARLRELTAQMREQRADNPGARRGPEEGPRR